DNARRARTGAALMAARFKRAVQRGTASAIAGSLERAHLGVRFTGTLVKTLADDDAVRRDDDGADQRIRARPPGAPRRVKQRPLHVHGIPALHAALPLLFEQSVDVLLRRERHEIVNRL